MHVRYLWIDALCIIQNDINEQDWYVESGDMRHIYSNALFAIAADVSRGSNEGFLLEKYNTPRWRSFNGTQDGVKPQKAFFRVATCFKHGGPDTLLSSALSKRGWASQESILPNRIIHFTAHELIWECNKHCRCQCGKADYSLVKIACCKILKGRARHHAPGFIGYDDIDQSRQITTFLAYPTLESVYWVWQTIVGYYTQRQLTNPGGKLSALSGLAQVAINSHGFNGGDYLAGLWRGEPAKGLLWYVKGPVEPQRYTTYYAPSWSWASIDGGVKYFAEHYQFQFEADITILKAKCDTSPLDPTGRVKAGHILLNGDLAPVKLIVRKTGHCKDKSKYIGYNGQASHTHIDQMVYVEGDCHYEVLMDERMEYGIWESGYYCLEVGSTVDYSRAGARVWWLVLKEQTIAADGETSIFERVGIGYKHTTSPLDLFSRRKTIKLI